MSINYHLQQQFLDMTKQFVISNPTKDINEKVIYSFLINFNIVEEAGFLKNVENYFDSWVERYKNNKNMIPPKKDPENYFLWFENGSIKGNEIKLYIPLDINHLKEGANQLFDFISNCNIEHQSKISPVIRNDNVVVRVNSLEDAKTIMDYVSNNLYIKEGMLKVNPFLPSYKGVGITMDNYHSYNLTVSTVILEFLNYLKQYNRLDLFNVSELNKFIKQKVQNMEDSDLKDIYVLLSKTTEPDFKIQTFIKHAKNKKSDKYYEKDKKITDPKFYFEQALKVTYSIYPQNVKTAIFQYLKNNPNYFSNTNKARDGLVKYVRPGDVISLMRTKLYENNIPYPTNDNELIENYLNILLNNEYKKEFDDLFDIIANAYINTLSKYGLDQARGALKNFIVYGKTDAFTNKLKDRDRLIKILPSDIKKIILNNINIDNLDVNDIDEIINRFEFSIGLNQFISTKKTIIY